MTPGENRGFFGFAKLVSAHFANDAFCGVCWGLAVWAGHYPRLPRLPRLRVICAPFGRLFSPASIAGRFAANTGGLSPGLFNRPVWPRLGSLAGRFPVCMSWGGFAPVWFGGLLGRFGGLPHARAGRFGFGRGGLIMTQNLRNPC